MIEIIVMVLRWRFHMMQIPLNKEISEIIRIDLHPIPEHAGVRRLRLNSGFTSIVT